MIYTGTKAVTAAGTAEPLSATTLMVSTLIVQAKADNTDKVYVGGSNVTAANGLCLDEVLLNHIEFPSLLAGTYIDLNQVYVDADVNGEAVNFVYGLP